MAAASVTRTLRSQLQAIGYSPKDIDYVSVSHAHIDHSANLNQFAGSTWLVRPAERDFLLDDWRGRESDLLFRLPFRPLTDAPALPPALVCLLVEHQSEPDRRDAPRHHREFLPEIQPG